jgi:hypothetical protein
MDSMVPTLGNDDTCMSDPTLTEAAARVVAILEDCDAMLEQIEGQVGCCLSTRGTSRGAQAGGPQPGTSLAVLMGRLRARSECLRDRVVRINQQIG